jgi:hypothetical protein
MVRIYEHVQKERFCSPNPPRTPDMVWAASSWYSAISRCKSRVISEHTGKGMGFARQLLLTAFVAPSLVQ